MAHIEKINTLIDWFHALWNQHGKDLVTLDGDTETVESICRGAIKTLSIYGYPSDKHWHTSREHPDVDGFYFVLAREGRFMDDCNPKYKYACMRQMFPSVVKWSNQFGWLTGDELDVEWWMPVPNWYYDGRIDL